MSRYRRKRRPVLRAVFIAISMLLVTAAAAGIVAKREQISAQFMALAPVPPAESAPAPAKPTPPPAAPVIFPRRALLVAISDYLYANRVSAGTAFDNAQSPDSSDRASSDRSVHGVFKRLCDALQVPEAQRLELSDSAPAGSARPPIKTVIQGTVEDFLDSCRSQDRVLLLFIGHAVTLDNEAYLVPIEGELAMKETLIPFAWLYGRLAACKARQKVLVIDVCRYDPSRGLERPDGGAMSAVLDAALKNPPTGVQVWSACITGEHSYEGYLDLPNGDVARAGFFLDALYSAVGPYRKNKVELGQQHPQDALPLDALAKTIDPIVQKEVRNLYRAQETPRVAGHEGPGPAYNPAEAPAPRPVIRMPPPPPGGAADHALVESILNEINSFPPVGLNSEGTERLHPDALPPFAANVLDAYRDNGKRTPFREAVKKAMALLREPRMTKAFEERFTGKGGDAKIKAAILARQREPAIIQGDLEEALAELEEAGNSRDREPSRRWQADYDFVLARLEARIAYVHEYNYMLALIRKDALPPREPIHTGWRLASREKLQSDTDARKRAADARKTLLRLAREHRGTPWEIVARREALTALGLEWKPTR
jgi:hypothetical protein